jgi:hypothetical protein
LVPWAAIAIQRWQAFEYVFDRDCGSTAIVAAASAAMANATRMSVRFQFAMSTELRKRAKARAAELGLTFSEYISQLIASDLGEDKPKSKADISVVFDLGASRKPTDVARDKQKMIAEAVWEDYLRKVGRKARPRNQTKTRRS